MAHTRPATSQLAQLRADLTRRHIPHAPLTDQALSTVLTTTGHLGLAADAIAMYPRPRWVTNLIGPFPTSAIIDLQLTEMRHSDDRASTDEWGHAG